MIILFEHILMLWILGNRSHCTLFKHSKVVASNQNWNVNKETPGTHFTLFVILLKSWKKEKKSNSQTCLPTSLYAMYRTGYGEWYFQNVLFLSGWSILLTRSFDLCTLLYHANQWINQMWGSKWVIVVEHHVNTFQLYHVENKLHFNKMMSV